MRLALALLLVIVSAAGAATPPPRSGLVGEPGYVAPVDPDSNAVRTGRRTAPAVSKLFTGGAPSIESLVRRALARAGAGDRAGLAGLCIARDEFEQILWPEFPQSRPVTGATAGDGWYLLTRRNSGGEARMLDNWAGAKLKLVRIERAMAVETYRNFRLHRGLTIVAQDSTGAEVRIDDIRSIAERKGVFKIYSLRD